LASLDHLFAGRCYPDTPEQIIGQPEFLQMYCVMSRNFGVKESGSNFYERTKFGI